MPARKEGAQSYTRMSAQGPSPHNRRPAALVSTPFSSKEGQCRLVLLVSNLEPPTQLHPPWEKANRAPPAGH